MRSLLLDLRRELLAAVGAAALLPACSGDDGGASTSAGSEATSDATTAATSDTTTDTTTGDPGTASMSSTSAGTASASGTSGTSDATSGTVTTDPSTTDPSTTDPSTSGTVTTDATTSTTTDGTTTGGADCEPPPIPPPEYIAEYACFPLPDGLTSCDECGDDCLLPELNAAITQDPFFCSAQGLTVLCGPDSDAPAGSCCYHAAHQGIVCEGRPLRVDGEVRIAPLAARGDWQDGLGPHDLAGLDEVTRAALADAWAEDGRMEHASIAAFARLILHLMAHGAPSELIAATNAALADEVAHARACFALAGDYAGRPRGPGALPIAGALGRAPTLVELAAATVLEGCVGESIAAAIARVSAAGARAPHVRPQIERIAADESSHAALAWRLVRWALDRGGVIVEAAVRDAFAQALADPPVARSIAAPIDPDAWQAHGRLPHEVEAAVIRETLQGVIAPCARALLGESLTARLPRAAGPTARA